MHLFYFFFLFLTFQSHLLWVKWTFRELFHSTSITLTTFLSNASEIWTLAPNEVLAQSKCHLKLTHFISWNLITPDPLTRWFRSDSLLGNTIYFNSWAVNFDRDCHFSLFMFIFYLLALAAVRMTRLSVKQPTAKTLFRGMGVCLCECVESSSFGLGCECLPSKI